MVPCSSSVQGAITCNSSGFFYLQKFGYDSLQQAAVAMPVRSFAAVAVPFVAAVGVRFLASIVVGGVDMRFLSDPADGARLLVYY